MRYKKLFIFALVLLSFYSLFAVEMSFEVKGEVKAYHSASRIDYTLEAKRSEELMHRCEEVSRTLEENGYFVTSPVLYFDGTVYKKADGHLANIKYASSSSLSVECGKEEEVLFLISESAGEMLKSISVTSIIPDKQNALTNLYQNAKEESRMRADAYALALGYSSYRYLYAKESSYEEIDEGDYTTFAVTLTFVYDFVSSGEISYAPMTVLENTIVLEKEQGLSNAVVDNALVGSMEIANAGFSSEAAKENNEKKAVSAEEMSTKENGEGENTNEAEKG